MSQKTSFSIKTLICYPQKSNKPTVNTGFVGYVIELRRVDILIDINQVDHHLTGRAQDWFGIVGDLKISRFIIFYQNYAISHVLYLQQKWENFETYLELCYTKISSKIFFSKTQLKQSDNEKSNYSKIHQSRINFSKILKYQIFLKLTSIVKL